MKVGFVGLGRMGHAMAERLLTARYEVIVYNRTAAKSSGLVAQGARHAASIAALARDSDLVISMLADDSALRAVTQTEDGLIASLPAGGIHVAMGTHAVDVIRSLASAHAHAGQIFLAAPVLGRPDAVTAGRLGVIVAGEPAAVERCKPVLESLGRRVFFAGPDPGSASAMKLANNLLLACAIEALGEAFALVEKSGVDTSVFQDMIGDGLFACPAYTTYSKIIADKAWDKVGFTVELGLKDVDLALAAGRTARVPLPSANVCRDRLLGAIAHGDAHRDWSAMALDQARASGLP
ncbi:MAG: NAD(P)-dependent oxidoreductase [Pseudomonadota bacterium]|nr:NAD(P)-dependent oxidoreductase [Pseudomonadota bacterium]